MLWIMSPWILYLSFLPFVGLFLNSELLCRLILPFPETCKLSVFGPAGNLPLIKHVISVVLHELARQLVVVPLNPSSTRVTVTLLHEVPNPEIPILMLKTLAAIRIFVDNSN